MTFSFEVNSISKENVVVVGGGSMFPGFLERLHKELKELCPDNASPSVVGQPNRYTR